MIVYNNLFIYIAPQDEIRLHLKNLTADYKGEQMTSAFPDGQSGVLCSVVNKPCLKGYKISDQIANRMGANSSKCLHG